MSTEILSLPEVPFGKHSISRLIVGENPLHGCSHQTRLMDMQMQEYYTPDRNVELLRRCRAQGINTWQAGYSQCVSDALLRFREEGGEMQFICNCGPDQITNKDTFSKVLLLNPLGVAFHGEVTDVLWRTGKINTIDDVLAQIRDSGVMVGLSTHNPEVIDYTEGEGWDLDFYMFVRCNQQRPY